MKWTEYRREFMLPAALVVLAVLAAGYELAPRRSALHPVQFLLEVETDASGSGVSGVVDESMQVLRRRLEEMGSDDATVERKGDRRILVTIRDVSGTESFAEMLTTQAKLSFQLVDEDADIAQAMRGIVPIGSVLLPMASQQDGGPVQEIVLRRKVLVSGAHIVEARASFDQRTGEPDISFRFDEMGTKQFGDATRENVGHSFAVVLDGRVITAPRIVNPILNGSGIITGSFTIESAKELATLLSVSALPAPLKLLERRSLDAKPARH